ncbi:hypothetical protein DVH24_026869 [Malus domestica]|uniref:Uncharacterized protein n=1 Tax=Malus domestica TaxID=3750 RepID=A0A498KQ91_MALDO|nr:hypothetical protein DVH24_026869 [Malus domestica]
MSQSTNLASPRNYPFSLENVPAGHNQLATMSTNNPRTRVQYIHYITELTINLKSSRSVLRFTEVMDTQEKPREIECDLSLTLGPVVHPCTRRSLASGMEDIGSSNSQDGEKSGRSSEATVRKRKAPFSSNEEDRQYCWQPDVVPNRFTGRTTGPGL